MIATGSRRPRPEMMEGFHQWPMCLVECEGLSKRHAVCDVLMTSCIKGKKRTTWLIIYNMLFVMH